MCFEYFSQLSFFETAFYQRLLLDVQREKSLVFCGYVFLFEFVRHPFFYSDVEIIIQLQCQGFLNVWNNFQWKKKGFRIMFFFRLLVYMNSAFGENSEKCSPQWSRAFRSCSVSSTNNGEKSRRFPQKHYLLLHSHVVCKINIDLNSPWNIITTFLISFWLILICEDFLFLNQIDDLHLVVVKLFAVWLFLSVEKSRSYVTQINLYKIRFRSERCYKLVVELVFKVAFSFDPETSCVCDCLYVFAEIMSSRNISAMNSLHKYMYDNHQYNINVR